MRIEVDKLVEIQNITDCQVEVGADENDVITLRFGYWNHIDKDLFKSMFPSYLSIEQFLVDDDSDCGPLYIYYVWDDRFTAMDKQEFKKEQKYKMVGWSLIGLAICIIYILLDKYIF